MKQLEIHGYKSIKDLVLPLREINILIGANGSGKSNLLSFFVFLKTFYNRNLQESVALSGGMDKFLYMGRKITSEISIKLLFPKNAYSFTLVAGEDAFVITKEGLWYEANPHMPNPIDIASFSKESRLQYATEPRADYIRNYLSELKKYHFHDTSKNSPFTKVSNVKTGGHYLLPQGENLAAFLYTVSRQTPKNYNLIVQTIQTIAPYFRDFYLKPDENGNLSLKWQDKYSENIYGATDLSDGTIRFIALTTLFMQPQLPQTIILDEPELGLHPVAIAKLSGMIKSVAAKGCQIIVATQSTDLISYFDVEDIITVDQINGESIYKRLSSDELEDWLEEYTIDELWKRNMVHNGQPNNQEL